MFRSDVIFLIQGEVLGVRKKTSSALHPIVGLHSTEYGTKDSPVKETNCSIRTIFPSHTFDMDASEAVQAALDKLDSSDKGMTDGTNR